MTLLLIFALMSSFVYSQDVIVTLTATNLGVPLPLDSIHLRNLTNGTSGMVDQLPDSVLHYDIDLMHGKVIGGMGGHDPVYSGIFPEGTSSDWVKFRTVFPRSGVLQARWVDLQGRILRSDVIRYTAGEQLHTLTRERNFQGLLVLHAEREKVVFKVLGTLGPRWAGEQEPQPLLRRTGDFLFTPGDSVRLTVYGHEIYADSIDCLPVHGDSLQVMVARRCPGIDKVTDYDGNHYNAVLIGAQCWLMENMKAIHYADGRALTNGAGRNNTNASAVAPFYYDYNNDPAYSYVYGRLYNGPAATDGKTFNGMVPVQGVCPQGWHVPSDSEWNALELFLGVDPAHIAQGREWRGTDEGGMLKDRHSGLWDSPNLGATNESGFSALPGGFWNPELSFFGLHRSAYWWSSFSWSGSMYFLVSRGLTFDKMQIYYSSGSPVIGKSVRCLKDSQ